MLNSEQNSVDQRQNQCFTPPVPPPLPLFPLHPLLPTSLPYSLRIIQHGTLVLGRPQRWFCPVVLKVLEIFWVHSEARGGPWSTPKIVLSSPVLSIGLLLGKEFFLHVNINLKCNLLTLQKEKLRAIGQKELKMEIFGLLSISSLALSL